MFCFLLPLGRYQGLFNNYFRLKLPFLTHPLPTITNDHKNLTLRHARHRYSLYHLFLFFFEVEKKKPQRYAPTRDTSTHVFKQLNQIAKFK